MKIGILTHPLASNYGGILQNYALQTVLKQIGHAPVTLDYVNDLSCKIKMLSVVKRLLRRLRGENIPLRVWPTDKELEIIELNVRRFINNNINRTRRVRFSELAKLKSEGFEALIVGSDQVWRGDRGHIERYFFSDFTDLDVPKISYAASMGVDWWSFSESDTVICRQLATKFKAVSVREASAVRLCKEHLNINATLVLDPTLLLNKEDYESLLNGGEPDKQHKQMMVYVLDKSNAKSEIVQAMGEKLQLQPHSVMADAHFYEVGQKGLEYCIFPAVEDWLKGFRDADYVVTDSFHGMVFSVIFNKQFVAIANNKRGRSRFSSFLEMLGLGERLVESKEQAHRLLDRAIDYNRVNQLLNLKRKESLEFLRSNL